MTIMTMILMVMMMIMMLTKMMMMMMTAALPTHLLLQKVKMATMLMLLLKQGLSELTKIMAFMITVTMISLSW